MPGLLYHVNFATKCTHQAPALVAPSQTRVLVSGQPVVTMPVTITIAGCPFTVPGPKPQPCLTVKWLMASGRVKIMGQPPALTPAPGPAPALCQSAEQIPQGPPIVGSVQTRVFAL